MECHTLPFKDECEKCFVAMSSKDVERIEIFSSILTKHEITEKKILNGDSFSSEDAAIVSEKLTELSPEGAKAVYSELIGTSSDKDWRDWRVFLQMIFTWEEENKDKRQFLLKLRSITFADESDADKIQQIVNSHIKGYYQDSSPSEPIKNALYLANRQLQAKEQLIQKMMANIG
ncbi:PREDICTED: uncharacterized protein LOC109592273 [Amphimedon queenslandica]|uniref:Uncharacterized protein n=1 Tax=Amphimedon queenslandica TaxID=400682 RepID=A0AAN0K222_AMPQE|nr:PREDICTED: uncharacterized protein LOC109592273 [Amphimedon queenslandica]|eukprot:XP_019863324.1 PREDICTED: uncharacterized protein LOC109592273 [Amphimedon queenslandica]